MRPVDYGLIYRLEDERERRERAYICPMWDWVTDFSDRFRQEPWWDRILKPGYNGCIWPRGLGFWSDCIWGHISGEIVNPTILSDAI